jgi:hypothetical protein
MADMVQTYQGYIQDGRFISVDGTLSKIPEKRRSELKVFTDEIINEDAIQKRLKALDVFYAELASIDDEPLDEEFDAL